MIYIWEKTMWKYTKLENAKIMKNNTKIRSEINKKVTTYSITTTYNYY